MLRRAGAPSALLLIITKLILTMPREAFLEDKYLFAEFFAGIANVAQAFRDEGDVAKFMCACPCAIRPLTCAAMPTRTCSDHDTQQCFPGGGAPRGACSGIEYIPAGCVHTYAVCKHIASISVMHQCNEKGN
jgi:hypothetical protein